MNNRQVVEQWMRAMHEHDVVALEEILHPDLEVTYPQSGEVIRGRENLLGMLASFPGRAPEGEVEDHHPTHDAVHVVNRSPFGLPNITVESAGDTFTLEGSVVYGDGATYHVVTIVQVRDGMIATETSYFAPPFDPPEWRRPFVDPSPPTDG